MKKALLVLLVTVLVSLEFGARLYLVAHTASPYVHPVDFEKERVAAYQTMQLGIDGYWHIVSNYSGHYIHVENGQRRTVGQPIHSLHTLYFFGASTGFDADADDSNTIASRLQALIGSTVRVENMSVTSATMDSRLALLQTIPLRAGDVVIFYVGANEAGQLLEKSSCISDRLALLVLFCSRTPQDVYSRTRQNAVLFHFQNIERTAKSYIIQHGATFYLVLQPIARYENSVWTTADQNFPGYDDAVTIMYPLFRTNADIDLSLVLDKDQSMFVDQSHVTAKGNAIIAQALFEQLRTF